MSPAIGDGRSDPAAAIAALRARGAHHADPVRFRHIEALVRRATAHQGETRRLLDGKLAQLLAACGQVAELARSPAATDLAQAPHRSALAGLLAHIALHAAAPGAHAGNGVLDGNAPTELKTVRYFRSTWSRLSVDQRMAQSLALVSDNAGPLNTQRLLHQALMVMRDASPEYVQRFMSHVEALLWLDQASPAGSLAKKAGARIARGRKQAGENPANRPPNPPPLTDQGCP